MDPLNRPIQPVRSRQKRQPLSVQVKNTYRLLMGTLLIFFVSGSLAYFFVNIQKSAKGYLLQDLEMEYETLSSQKRALEHEVMESESLRNLTEGDHLDSMVPWSLPNVSFIHENEGLARNGASE